MLQSIEANLAKFTGRRLIIALSANNMGQMTQDLAAEVTAVGQIDAVPTILDVVCSTTGMRFAAVARVTEDRWIACSVLDNIAFGLQPGGELKIETTICNEIRASLEPVVINHVAIDDAWCRHPTPAMYGFQSYISMPIVLPDGQFFGTLCAIDPRPVQVNTPAIVGMFRMFAQLIGFHIAAIERLKASESVIYSERQTSELREQFIAVLGHDLRNPLASIDAGTKLLAKTPLNARAKTLLDLMRGSVARMSGLIDNVLDLARSRMAGGLPLNRCTNPLEPTLRQVVAELHLSHPDRDIDLKVHLNAPIDCDHARIGQLFSNLLGNALTHGAVDAPIRVQALTDGKRLELSVANAGDPIPPEAHERLFQPFFRGAARASLQGLGLGLYIASEIARAHDGTLTVASSAEETRFAFRMPLNAPHDAETTSPSSRIRHRKRRFCVFLAP